jgi:hypothetical protein
MTSKIPNCKVDQFHETHSRIAALIIGVSLMTQMTKIAQTAPNARTDPRIDPQIRSFLADLNKDSSPFWELPQPSRRKFSPHYSR